MWQIIKNNTCVILQLITLSTMVFTFLASLYYKWQNNKRLTQNLNLITSNLKKDILEIKKDILKLNKDIIELRNQNNTYKLTLALFIENSLYHWFDYYKRYNGLKMEDITRMSAVLSSLKVIKPDTKYISILEKELMLLYKKQKGA